MLRWLERSGVPTEHITIFASDGEDPGADLAVRELRPDGEVDLLDGTNLEGRLGRPIEHVSTHIEGFRVRPATRTALEVWFDTVGREIRPGDTLVLYVTDHGLRGKASPEETRIALWGRKESITVTELGDLLAKLDPGVRVVALMSQCFSGGFARLGDAEAESCGSLPTGRVCGYFSSTEDRPAYGCYPENRGKQNIGHSVRFIEALTSTGDFAASQRATLVVDRTPDVPLRTSDVQLERLLDTAAGAQGKTLESYADEMLAEAWRDRGAWEPQIRLLDRIGQSFGVASPRSLAEVDERLRELPQVAEPLAQYSKAWRESLADLSQANLDRFLDANPTWRDKVSNAALDGREATDLRDLGDAMVADLTPFTRADAQTAQRLTVLRERAEEAGGASYRMSVREAALLRMRAELISIAGRVYLTSHARPQERAAFEKLAACEAFALAQPEDANDPPADASAEPDLPPYDDDLRIAREVAPAWMGISFNQPTPEQKSRLKIGSGAVAVREVFPDSPAERAGLEVGDFILGPPDKPFTEPRQVREWTMLREVGEPAKLDVLHDDRVASITLVPDRHPGKFPELPGPPKVGSAAPPVELESYRGAAPTALADGRERLLFFWATWCGPCKASLPEVTAFARERGAEVIAVTDEEPETLDRFFASFPQEFPQQVARDPKRKAFRSYGVSGTPTFVFIDGTGKVQGNSTGYAPAKGIGVPGWKWAGPAGPNDGKAAEASAPKG